MHRGRGGARLDTRMTALLSQRRTRRIGARGRGSARSTQSSPRTEQRLRRPLELDPIASRWQQALDAAERSLRAASEALPGSEVADRRRRLTRERAETSETLLRLARTAGVQPPPWLSPVPVTTAMLGLSPGVGACL